MASGVVRGRGRGRGRCRGRGRVGARARVGVGVGVELGVEGAPGEHSVCGQQQDAITLLDPFSEDRAQVAQ